MGKPSSEEVKHQWLEKIQKQRASGLSIQSWCKANNIINHVFYYWEKKIFPKSIVDRSDFVELSNKKNADALIRSEIFIEVQGMRIHVDRQFDPSTLKQCLKVIKEMSC
jgi:hypothetical protein